VETATWPVIPLILQPVKLPPRLAMLTALDATDSAGWTDALKRLCKELRRPVPGPSPKPPCPYPGMVPYSEADRNRFFGRDQEVESLLQQLRLHPFLAVIGPSGSGKSSLAVRMRLPSALQVAWVTISMWPARVAAPYGKRAVSCHLPQFTD
jgi:hypothetical protein